MVGRGTRFGSVRNSLEQRRRPRSVRGHGRGAGPVVLRRHRHPPGGCADAAEGSADDEHSHDQRSTTPAISAAGIRKSYGDKVVLDGVDLSVAEGTVFALLGPERRRQDDDGADPVDADPGRRDEAFVGGHDLARAPTGYGR